MKTGTTFDRIQVRSLPTGRRCLAARQTRAEAEALAQDPLLTDAQRDALTHLATLCADADAQCQTCSDLERRYAADALTASKTPSPRIPIDQEADHYTASIRDNAQIFTSRLPASDPNHQAAQRFLAAAFPKGLRHITQVSYPEQLQRMPPSERSSRSEVGPSPPAER
jgi:hypothetical protein